MTAERALDLRQTAAHEAGHAVAAWSLGIKFIEISIVPNDDSEGRVTYTAGGWIIRDDIPYTRKAREHLLITLLAGGVADRRYGGRQWSDLGVNGDLQRWLDVNASMGGSKAAQTRRIEVATYKAMEVIDEHWKAVTALAEALVERKCLTEREALKVIRSKVPGRVTHRQDGHVGSIS
jgi:ATP-dependent Zn protease